MKKTNNLIRCFTLISFSVLPVKNQSIRQISHLRSESEESQQRAIIIFISESTFNRVFSLKSHNHLLARKEH